MPKLLAGLTEAIQRRNKVFFQLLYHEATSRSPHFQSKPTFSMQSEVLFRVGLKTIRFTQKSINSELHVEQNCCKFPIYFEKKNKRCSNNKTTILKSMLRFKYLIVAQTCILPRQKRAIRGADDTSNICGRIQSSVSELVT